MVRWNDFRSQWNGHSPELVNDDLVYDRFRLTGLVREEKKGFGFLTKSLLWVERELILTTPFLSIQSWDEQTKGMIILFEIYSCKSNTALCVFALGVIYCCSSKMLELCFWVWNLIIKLVMLWVRMELN